MMIGSKAVEAATLFMEENTKKLKPTQHCHRCGCLVSKTLADRMHRCECGCVCGRDENSARCLWRWMLEGDFWSGTGQPVGTPPGRNSVHNRLGLEGVVHFTGFQMLSTALDVVPRSGADHVLDRNYAFRDGFTINFEPDLTVMSNCLQILLLRLSNAVCFWFCSSTQLVQVLD